jgi:preprotein translocase subunit SecB
MRRQRLRGLLRRASGVVIMQAPGLGSITLLYINRIDFTIDQTFVMPEAQPPLKLDIQLAVSRRPLATERQMQLRIEIRKGSDAAVPYYGTLEVVAVLNDLPEMDSPEKVDHHAAMVGASACYSTAREALLNVTGRCQFPRLLLPLFGMQTMIAQMSVYDVQGARLYGPAASAQQLPATSS